MTSISFAGAPEAARGFNPTAASHSANTPQLSHNNSSGNLNSAVNSENGQRTNSTASFTFRGSNNDRSSIFHAHRQNHNSSKLPAFRFADLKREPISLPSLLQQTGTQPSPAVSQPSPTTNNNDPSENQENAHEQAGPSQHSRQIPGSARESLHHFNSAQNLFSDKPVAFDTPQTIAQNSQQQQQYGIPRVRSLKFQLPSATATSTATATVSATLSSAPDPSTGSKRPASFPDTPRVVGNVYATPSRLAYVATPVTKRRLTASTTVVQDAAAATSHRPYLSSIRLQTAETDDIDGDVPESATKEWAQGQRDRLGPRTTTVDIARSEERERKRARPPVSYKQITVPSAPSAPPSATPSTTSTAPDGRAVIPPIRNFRSSGSRKSVVLDMPIRRVADEYGDELSNPNQRDRTLRALEGRDHDDDAHPSETDMTTTTDNDNTADIFMKIAGEAAARRAQEVKGRAEDSSAISRITRISHRRPLSAAVANFRATSPPQLARRLSDQRETSRTRQRAESQSTAQQMTRELAYRTSREKPAPLITTSSTVTEDPSSTRTVSIRTPLKPSPITPRSIQFQDSLSESYQRRRQSVTENHATGIRTAPQYRSSNLAQSRIYNSSPLVPKSINAHKDEPVQNGETHQVAEGTESSSSTAAPSTVWDELDDLKSRINRLEITGKMPATSGAAMSRTSADERPPTANTNATTMSASPKRGSEAKTARQDAVSTTSSQREAQPLLLSAVQKTKGFVSAEVFSAMESAANDALALSTMIGTPGQPGPISSGASVIGYSGGVTDRQLRRKADSVCRSLTELCIALADELGQTKPAHSGTTREDDVAMSPTSRRPVAAASAPSSRRPSALADSIQRDTQPLPPKSPRAPTSLEVKRQTLLASTAIPSVRYPNNTPATPVEPLSAGRKSSLLLSRARRVGTEDPEEVSGRRSSLLLRTRRAGAEEPEEAPPGRKTSLLLRTRKTMNDQDEDESRFRTPSRAVTEVNSFRTVPRDVGSAARAPPDIEPQGSQSALPRRRLVPMSLQSRMSLPVSSATTPSTPIPRRYLERNMLNGESSTLAERLAEERGQRQVSGGQASLLNRSSSLHRRSRESHIPSLQSQQQQQQQQQQQYTSSASGYR
ncbi:hypothetical protein QBC35DRAFT_389712 [Podospora australis]|uniref:LPXTG-motif cell wall anchor domain protein n=1 Tax=Podospora australis TaxID=1536484 RepID=A0AAN6WNK2_9PEZI|nr:hypothetical protein QBC35DRAFT_389712 [Podospora australis]